MPPETEIAAMAPDSESVYRNSMGSATAINVPPVQAWPLQTWVYPNQPPDPYVGVIAALTGIATAIHRLADALEKRNAPHAGQ